MHHVHFHEIRVRGDRCVNVHVHLLQKSLKIEKKLKFEQILTVV